MISLIFIFILLSMLLVRNVNSIVLDEGTELLSRETQKQTNMAFLKTFFVQRVLGYLVITDIPNFFMLDNVIRLHRVRTLITITDRGY